MNQLLVPLLLTFALTGSLIEAAGDKLDTEQHQQQQQPQIGEKQQDMKIETTTSGPSEEETNELVCQHFAIAYNEVWDEWEAGPCQKCCKENGFDYSRVTLPERRCRCSKHWVTFRPPEKS